MDNTSKTFSTNSYPHTNHSHSIFDTEKLQDREYVRDDFQERHSGEH